MGVGGVPPTPNPQSPIPNPQSPRNYPIFKNIRKNDVNIYIIIYI
jgi:hypothetical protein